MATERVEITFAARSRPTPEDEAMQYARDKRAMEWAYPKEDGIAPPTPWWRRFPGVEVGATLADTLARHLRERAVVVEEASPTRLVVADGYERVLRHLDEFGHCFDRTMRRIADGP